MDALIRHHDSRGISNLMNVWTSKYACDFVSLFNTLYEGCVLNFLGGDDDAQSLIKMSFLHKRVIAMQAEMKEIERNIQVNVLSRRNFK